MQVTDCDWQSISHQQSVCNLHSAICNLMRLYIDTMDVVVVDVDGDGRVRYENEDWSGPTLQERRAIIFAAQQEMAALTELVETLTRI